MTFDPTPGSTRRNSDSTDLEHKMRRTLGVDAPSQGHRRRFARDGDGPVVVRGRRDADRDAVETELRAEREARQQAERLLIAAQGTIRDLQTKLAHTEIALAETREAVHRAEERAGTLDATLADQTAAIEMVEQRLAKETAARRARETPLADERRQGRSTPVATMQPRRTVTRFREDQDPVDWWSKHEKAR